MSLLDATDKRLLDALQGEFPLEAEPFARLGESLDEPADAVRARVTRLKDAGIIRQISAIFDSRRLGYQSCLAAASAPPEQIEAVAAVISRHPGVSHNYEREHPLNLWFTLTLPREQDLAAEAARLQRESGAERLLLLPEVRRFKIAVRLRFSGAELPPASAPRENDVPEALTAAEIRAVRALQQDLPIVPHPFAALAREAALNEAELIQQARELLAQGRMRRFAAVLHHRRVGFTANGMVVWKAAAEQVEAAGRQMAACAAVSHCYQRLALPDWPYSLYTMIHGRSREACARIAAELAAMTGLTEYAILFSTREFKKVRVRYFEE